jgi:hypothetical protein
VVTKMRGGKAMFAIKVFRHFLLALVSGGSLFALVFFASVTDPVT